MIPQRPQARKHSNRSRRSLRSDGLWAEQAIRSASRQASRLPFWVARRHARCRTATSLAETYAVYAATEHLAGSTRSHDHVLWNCRVSRHAEGNPIPLSEQLQISSARGSDRRALLLRGRRVVVWYNAVRNADGHGQLQCSHCSRIYANLMPTDSFLGREPHDHV